MAIKKPRENAASAAETLAIQALAFLGEDAERLDCFLGVTGIGPSDLRAAAAEPQFLAGVMEYVAGDEALLLKFANYVDLDPQEVARACSILAGGPWERDTP